jgi:hypothetical protein
MMHRIIHIFVVLLVSVIVGRIAFAQSAGVEISPAGDEFTFVRIQYENLHGGFDGGFDDGDGWGMRSTWAIDYPAADHNFLRGVRRLTHIHINSNPIVLRLDDDRIFEYPFLYMLEVGRSGGPSFTEKEIQNLREYLLRGGFLFIDDFWGTWQWDTFYGVFSKIFPDRSMVDLDQGHQIFHCFYDIDGPQMIPRVFNPENYPEQDVDRPFNRAILDDDGRVMVLINWNSDMGDGWEHTYHPGYPTKYANMAYKLGINYLIYALTH